MDRQPIRVVVLVHRIWLNVRFDCRLGLLLKNQLSQKVAESPLNYPLVNGSCQPNHHLHFETTLATLSNKCHTLKLIVTMASANGIVPAGYVILHPQTRKHNTPIEMTLSLERCQDQQALVKLVHTHQLIDKVPTRMSLLSRVHQIHEAQHGIEGILQLQSKIRTQRRRERSVNGQQSVTTRKNRDRSSAKKSDYDFTKGLTTPRRVIWGWQNEQEEIDMAKMATLQEEFRILKAEKEELMVINEQQQAQLQQLKEVVQQMQADNATKDVKVASVEAEIQKFARNMDQITTDLQLSRKQIVGNTKRQQEKDEAINTLNQQLQKLASSKVQIEKRLEQLQEEHSSLKNTLQEQVSSCYTRIQELEATAEAFQTNQLQLEVQLDSYKSSEQRLQLNIEELEAQIQEGQVSSQGLIEEKQDKLEEATQKYNQAQEHIKTLKARIVSINQAHALGIESMIEKHEKQTQQLTEQKEELEQQLETAKTHERTLLLTISKLKQDIKEHLEEAQSTDKLKELLGQLENNVTTLQECCENLQQQKESLEDELAQSQRNATAMEEFSSILQREKKGMEEQLAKRAKRIIALEQQLSHISLEKQQKQNELYASQQRNNQQKGQFIKKLASLEQQFEFMGNSLIKEEEEKSALTMTYSKLQEHSKKLQRTNSQLEQEIDELLSVNEALRQQQRQGEGSPTKNNYFQSITQLNLQYSRLESEHEKVELELKASQLEVQRLKKDNQRLEEAVQDLKGQLSFVTALIDKERQEKSSFEKEQDKKKEDKRQASPSVLRSEELDSVAQESLSQKSSLSLSSSAGKKPSNS